MRGVFFIILSVFLIEWGGKTQAQEKNIIKEDSVYISQKSSREKSNWNGFERYDFILQ